jgi:putative transposase
MGDYKTVKRFHEAGHAHELTWTCYRRQPWLNDDLERRIVAEAMSAAATRHGFRTVAFVLMPEHLHWLVHAPAAEASTSALLFAVKRPASFRIKQAWQTAADPRLAEAMVRERPGTTCFRYWQEGGGYDRNVDNENTLRAMIEYIHANPVRRGLVKHPKDWPWSSWPHYERLSTLDWLPKVAGLPGG